MSGKDLGIADIFHSTALHYAVSIYVRLVRESPEDTTRIEYIKECIKTMVNKMLPEDLNKKAPFGIINEQTALEFAQTNGLQEIVELFPRPSN